MLKRFLSQDGFDKMLERLKMIVDNLVSKLNAHKEDINVHTTAAEKAKWNSTSNKLTDEAWVELMSAKNKAHVHDNKDTLDKIDDISWKKVYGQSHVHDNKSTLDKIDETSWLTVYGQVHNHDNKDILDQITQTEWNAINSAKNKAHTHDNKKTLDKIDDVSWLTVYGQTHEHSNKTVLDNLTMQDYSDFKGTVNKAHVHRNKSTLDKIDETAWLLVYGQTHEHENQSVLDKTTASYTAAEKTKLAGIAAGAEVNQNAFSTIATGSARYAATAKQSAFLIDGDGGTSVSLDTKTGRLTVSSHTHDNKAVLDQLNEEQWKFINGAANKAHVHENKGTLDKITDVGWNTVYGYTHSHDNKSVLDKTTASYTAADKKKLDGMDLSKYLPKSGGVMTGDIDMQTNKKDILVGTHKATTSDGTAVAGGSITTPGYVGYKLKDVRSFVGTVTGNDGVWWDAISVRHRNGYDDGVNYGMYLVSSLTSSGNLIWNKQTAANTWQGDRTLLDSVNYTNYAAKSNHTHDSIVNNSKLIAGSNNAAQWCRLGTLTSSENFSTAVISVWSGDGAKGNASQNSWFEIHIKDGWQSSQSATKACGVTVYRTRCGTVKVKVIPTAHDTFTVWVYLPWGYWNGNYAVNGRYKAWTTDFTHQTSEPKGTAADTAYYDQAFLTSTVANATTWNGLINDVDTYNSSDTWILVKKDNRIQHRYAGELDVNSAKTLTDSGWIDTTRNTSFTATSTVKCRKYGKLVEVRGEVTFSDTCGSPTVCTLPAGYRPATVVQACGITPSGKQYMIKADTSGVISFGSDSGSTFVKGTTYRVDLTYLLG